MFKALRIQNFQSHKDTKIRFCKGVNAFVGLSDAGKSSALRALYWLLYNSPAGDEFCSWWGGTTRVTLVLDTGQRIIRERNEKINQYRLGKQELKAVGRGKVPPAVSELLRMHDVNWQAQHDAPFLLTDSPTAVTKLLNSVVDLGEIDIALAAIGRKKRETKQRLDNEEVRESNLEDQLAALPDLVRAEKLLGKVESLQAEIDQRKFRRNRIRKGLKREQELAAELKASEKPLPSAKRFQVIGEGVQALNAVRERRERLSALVDRYEALNTDLLRKTAQIVVIGLQISELKKNAPKTCPTCGKEL